MQRELFALADRLSLMIEKAPSFNPSWTTASSKEADDFRVQIERASKDDWRKHVLWVDDRPGNNVYERRTIESQGVTFTLAESTKEALEILSNRRFGAIISDMGRREGPAEGYVLLDHLRRQRGFNTLHIICRIKCRGAQT